MLLISDTDYDDDEDDDDNADGDGNDIIGVKIVVGGLHVESTSVYWVACPSVCRHAVLLQSVTDTDKSYVASSLPFDGTGRHTIRHVLVVAAHSGTLVRLELPPSGTAAVWHCHRLELPPSAADHGGSMSGSRHVDLDAFQSFAVESHESDLTGLSVEATKPIFVTVSVSSKLNISSSSKVRPIQTDGTPSQSDSSVQNEQFLQHVLLHCFAATNVIER